MIDKQPTSKEHMKAMAGIGRPASMLPGPGGGLRRLRPTEIVKASAPLPGKRKAK